MKVSREELARLADFQRRRQVQLSTLLFVDVCSIKELKHSLGDVAAMEALEGCRSIVQNALGRAGEGEVVQTQGESTLIVFTRPSNAVSFAITLIAALREN